MSQAHARVVYLPLPVKRRKLLTYVYQVVDHLSRGELLGAKRALHALDLTPSLNKSSHELDVVKTDIGHLKARLLARVIIDLYESGWALSREGNEVYGIAPVWGKVGSTEALISEKARARRSVEHRRVDGLSSLSNRCLMRRMETPQGRALSATALLADGARLAESLSLEGASAVRPYLQLARCEDGFDKHTGLRLHDCFKYLRGYWSFPYETTPGRRLPILIRDAGQPHHPVCGLLCFVSPLPQLASRDSSFGWTAEWLEAIVAALDAPKGTLVTRWVGDAWALLAKALKATRGPSERSLSEDLSALLELTPRALSLKGLAKQLLTLGEEAARDLLCKVRVRLAAQLCAAVQQSLEGISFEDLGVSLEEVTLTPSSIDVLDEARSAAEADWRAARAGGAAKGEAREKIKYRRKRAQLALSMAEAWWELAPLRDALAKSEDAVTNVLRAMTGPRCDPWGDSAEGLSGGKGVSTALQRALRRHKIDMIASRVADLSVCGAIEPYRSLLGGKLAAMMALSSDVVRLYKRAYEGQVSEIQSQLAGRPIVRSAELSALVTTSFYAVGSAQYNRVSLPVPLGGARWTRVGSSDGQGTMHFSKETTQLMTELLSSDARGLHPSSDFGSGPSERLRKIRDALVSLKLPADELLTHGMSRIVYVARLSDECLFSSPAAAKSYADHGPSAAQVAEHWRQRWLSPRLKRPGVLSALKRFIPDEHLLSLQLSEWGGVNDNHNADVRSDELL